MVALKLVFVAARSWPAVGGMESYLRQLTTELATRHEVTVLAQGLDSGPRARLSETLRPPVSFEPFLDAGVRVEPLRVPARRRALMAPLAAEVAPLLGRYAHGRSRIAAARLAAAAMGPAIATATRGADVVHMWGGGLLGAAAERAARTTGAGFAITPFAHRGQWGDDPASARLYRSADRVLALLEADAALYRELGVEPARLEIAGVCSAGAAGNGAALRRRHGIDGPLVGFLGVRRPYKGYELLLEAATLAAKELPGLTLAFAGPGPAVAGRDGVRVVDLGEIDDAGRGDLLDAADLLCLPSLGEIFPVSILEAWSVGTPVLTSDIPPLAELARRSGGGLAVAREPAALAVALVELLRDPARLRALGAAGRRFWRDGHTVAASGRRHELVYEAIAGLEGSSCAA